MSKADNGNDADAQTQIIDTVGPDAPSIEDIEVGRRHAMRLGAGAVAAAAGLGAGAGTALGATNLNYGSDLVHDARVEETITIAEHASDMSTALEYIDDNGETVSLADAGAQVAENDDSDTPHNPVTLRADRFAAEDYQSFPRDLKYDSDSDGDVDSDDEDVSALDASHWTTDTSGTAGTLTFEDTDAAHGQKALRVATSSQTSGDVAKARFDLSTVGDTDATITDGIDRKRAQLVVDVASLPSGTSVYVRAESSAGNVKETWLDADADSTAAGTVATTTGVHAYQTPLGELTTDLDDVQVIEISVENGDADVTIAALNFEKEDDWEFGTQEYTNTDDEIDTQTITEPSGEFSIIGINTLGDALSSAELHDLKVDVEYRARHLPSEQLDDSYEDAERYDQDWRHKHVVNFEVPTAYDLSHGALTLRDEVLFPGSRYIEVEYVTAIDDYATVSDFEDDEYTTTSEASTYENASIGDDVTLSSSINAGEIIAVAYDYVVTENERSDQEATFAAAAGASSDGGGGFFSGARGTIMALAALITGAIAWWK